MAEAALPLEFLQADDLLSFEWLRPPRSDTVSEWADRNRYLTTDDSAEPGRWRTARAPFQRGIQDAFTDPDCEYLVLVKSAQIGWTQMLGNMVGRAMQLDPGPMLMVQPTVEMARAWSTERFDAMLDSSPALRGLISEAKSRDGTNNTLHKQFPGGHISMVGANSAAGLRSRPIRYLLLDEVSAYPAQAGKEGDPVALAVARTKNFRGIRKVVAGSTPTVEGLCRVSAMFAMTDQRKFHVPCPDCGHMQVLMPGGLQWAKDDPAAARYMCEACAVLIDHARKAWMLANGEWRGTAQGQRGHVGFWLNELYSPWSTWGEFAERWVQAKRLPETLQTFINEAMAELWDEGGGVKVEASDLEARAESYTVAAAEALVVTIAVDVQDDRLECYAKAWGLDREGWGLDHKVIWGDPAAKETWAELTEWRRSEWQTEDDRSLRASICVIDSGGHHTQDVYRYAKRHQRERVYAIKGVGGVAPVVGRPSKGNRYRVPLFPVGVNAAKSKLYKRLQIEEPGPGFQHYGAGFDGEWFEQLTSERMVKRRFRGVTVIEWVKRRDRNEAWDLEVYQIAAYEILNPNLDARAERVAARSGDSPDIEQAPEPDDKPAPLSRTKQLLDQHQSQTRRSAARPRKSFATAWKV